MRRIHCSLIVTPIVSIVLSTCRLVDGAKIVAASSVSRPFCRTGQLRPNLLSQVSSEIVQVKKLTISKCAIDMVQTVCC